MLTLNEKKVLVAVDEGARNPDDLGKKVGLPRDAILSIVEKLRVRGLLNVSEKVSEKYFLNDEGMKYLERGLPERRLLDLVSRGRDSVQDLRKELGPEFPIAIVWLSKLGLGKIEKGKVVLSDLGRKYLNEKLPTEVLLDLLKDGASYDKIPADLRRLLKERSKIVRVKEEKEISFDLSEEGRALLEKGISLEEEISNLTPEMIRTGSWRRLKFRRFDVEAPVPGIYPGRRHLFEMAREYIRRVWISMGFKEMNGPIIGTSFWNFDSLFVPQDHPAREMQDTFYVYPEYGDLPDGALVSRVREAHEKGVDGSRGWRYKWSEKEARRLVLRTHTTLLSAKTLARLKEEELPAKFFSVGKVFRNEALDWKHLFEFTQSEGIVVSPDVNFRHLLGYLKEFFSRLGFDRVRFRPHYFPYTEMSVEPEVYHPVKKEWVELGGAGIFRPEVVEPLLGEPIPVLAWGLGVERLIVDYYQINDLRDIYKNDVDQLRNSKFWWL